MISILLRESWEKVVAVHMQGSVLRILLSRPTSSVGQVHGAQTTSKRIYFSDRLYHYNSNQDTNQEKERKQMSEEYGDEKMTAGCTVMQHHGPSRVTVATIGKDGEIMVEHRRHRCLNLFADIKPVLFSKWRTSGIPLGEEAIHQLEVTFFPAGYPSSVSPGYARFSGWQALHHAASAANGVIASTFLLYGVGMSAGEAIPTAGALNWVLKDGLGQVGTLLFGRIMAQNFDVNARLWYLAASTKLNIAMGLEIATSMLPQFFLPLGATANAIKGLAWMAGGSSRSALNVAFAKENNIAEITAKATSQTICSSLIGTGFGLSIAAYVGQSSPLALLCFSGIAFVHLWTSWKSVKTVPLSTLNPTRLWLLAQDFVNKDTTEDNAAFKSFAKSRLSGDLKCKAFRTPADLCSQDPIIPYLSRDTRLIFGANLAELVNLHSDSVRIAFRAMKKIPEYKNSRYLIIPDDIISPKTFFIILHTKASSVDILQAALQVSYWKNISNRGYGSSWNINPIPENINTKAEMTKNSEETFGMIKMSFMEAERSLDVFVQKLQECGWRTEQAVVEVVKQRATW